MNEWKSMSTLHKIATVINCIAAVFIVIPWVKSDFLPIDTTYPAIALMSLCEAVLYWDKKRKMSYALIAAAVIVLICNAL